MSLIPSVYAVFCCFCARLFVLNLYLFIINNISSI
nr:MAG TPA: hypothetical protein [Caudoviricetes sp.]